MSGKGIAALIFMIIFIVSFLAWGVVRIVDGVNFNLNCESYLKIAADANTVEMAKPKLEKAIEYLEQHNLTSGITSIFFHNPKNDVGFFYQNLVASKAELDNVKPDATQLEKSNVLMKLRETLLDTGESTTVTHPQGISIYPYNALFFWWSILSAALAVLFGYLCYKAESY